MDELLSNRKQRGEQYLRIAIGDADLHPADRYSVARDVIADVLTTICGTSGRVKGGKIAPNNRAIVRANQLLDYALQTYIGDAEDYVDSRTHGKEER